MTLSNKITPMKCFQFFNSISGSACFVLFEVRLNNLTSKSASVTTFACANLALKTSAAKVLNSGVVIYLS